MPDLWELTRAHKKAEEKIRNTRPLIRLWNGEYELQHVCGNERRAQFSFISNDTGPGQLELPADSPQARWIHDHQGRVARGEGRNVHITVDYCGARWSGLMDKYSIEQKGDGDSVLVVDFIHDYEYLKWYSLWSNPFLPAAFQFPRAFTMAGPVTWILKMALFANLVREHNPLITMPDDPLDPAGWFLSLDQSQWHVVVKPTSFLEAMQSGVVWGVLISRWATFHDAAHIMLEDAELSVRADRWLEGDPEPWPGANLRNGALVIDIVDKSGIYIGTSAGGTVLDGLARTVVEFADDFIDSTATLIADAATPADYFVPGNRLTEPIKPYVVYQEGSNSPIETSAWINSPAKGVQVNVGGHSMPGVVCAPRGNLGGAGHTGIINSERDDFGHHPGRFRRSRVADSNRLSRRHGRHPAEAALRRCCRRLVECQIPPAGAELRLGTAFRVLPAGSRQGLHDRLAHGAAGGFLVNKDHDFVEGHCRRWPAVHDRRPRRRALLPR